MAVVWDHSQTDFCWRLKSAAKPAVFNDDTELTVIEDRATAVDEQGKNPGECTFHRDFQGSMKISIICLRGQLKKDHGVFKILHNLLWKEHDQIMGNCHNMPTGPGNFEGLL